jgi:nitric oxide reductase NorE protein
MSVDRVSGSAVAEPSLNGPGPEGDLRRRPRPHVPGEVGIWVFVLGDMMVFALLFGIFVYERADQVEVFERSQGALNVTFGAVNTLLLLTSSLFVVLGVRAVRERIRSDAGPILFVLAFLCGLAFVVNKYLEWSEKLRAGQSPADNDFYMYFYVLSGIHLLHVLIGLGVLVFLWRLSRRVEPGWKDIRALESGASYWHLVDLLWVVLFPLLYLLG